MVSPQQLDVVEAKLIGLDPGTGKVWLSMRQVHPDPLQDTLDSLLAEDLLPTGGGDLLEYPVDDGMEVNSNLIRVRPGYSGHLYVQHSGHVHSQLNDV